MVLYTFLYGFEEAFASIFGCIFIIATFGVTLQSVKQMSVNN